VGFAGNSARNARINGLEGVLPLGPRFCAIACCAFAIPLQRPVGERLQNRQMISLSASASDLNVLSSVNPIHLNEVLRIETTFGCCTTSHASDLNENFTIAELVNDFDAIFSLAAFRLMYQ
jgi:hypothetical protein